ncbi:MAG: ATP-dependent RecD-like DNA helicase [Lachnospiraceae bacterium]|nr:ATP-dependent RecD-like DNA helicase [Lachnospiraceae bacterium]
MSEKIEGYVEHIKYRNEANGYTVLSLETEEGEEVVVGSFPLITEGEYISVEGDFVDHRVHGPQFSMHTYEVKVPEDSVGMERYLGSGAIHGIGPAFAMRIVKKFKGDTFRIIEEEPERLAEVKGISIKKAMDIAVQFNEKQHVRQALMFLSDFGITTHYAMKIYEEYGERVYEIIRENPYKMAEDITGIGFKIADEIAAKAGIRKDSEYRIRSGILYTLMQGVGAGHVYLPKEMLLTKTAQLIGVEPSFIEDHLMELVLDKKLMIKTMDGQEQIFSDQYYFMELNAAKMLLDLNLSYPWEEEKLIEQIRAIEEELSIALDEKQREALMMAAGQGVLILTGGPGTGKTTTINALIRYFEKEGLTMMLAAPTGRAAKRMQEATGYDASTIHRLLEVNGELGMDSHFEKNASNPLDTDVIIIDEMSMVDINLMYALLKASVPGTKMILVGDSNQLPSVGPGNVLKDLIRSGQFPVVELKKIFRQAEKSDIVMNAHRINRGEAVMLNNKSQDFFFLERRDAPTITGVLVYLVRDKLPDYVDSSPFDIQVLTPMRKGELGVERLNQVLQHYLNPASAEKQEKEARGTLFREGDKVMQIKNNYKLEWQIRSPKGFVREEGVGVFNGDMGRIREINTFSEKVLVEFDEGRMVEYSYTMLDELELAYAITIHKSQGSEYPAVVMPLFTGPRVLFNRNLLYTAVTRARKCVTIVGLSSTVTQMIENSNELKRYTGLCDRLKEMSPEEENEKNPGLD